MTYENTVHDLKDIASSTAHRITGLTDEARGLIDEHRPGRRRSNSIRRVAIVAAIFATVLAVRAIRSRRDAHDTLDLAVPPSRPSENGQLLNSDVSDVVADSRVGKS
jgi:hypothetical protein